MLWAMAQTPRLKLTYPAEERAYWFEQFKTFAEAVDASLYAVSEDRQIIITGGGTVSWDSGTNTLTWGSAIKITSAVSGFVQEIAAGSATLGELEYLYWTVPRFPSDNRAVVLQRGIKVPSFSADILNTVAFAHRRDGRLYFRNGRVMASGESRQVFQSEASVSSGLITAGNAVPVAAPVSDTVGLYLHRGQNAQDTLWVYGTLDGWMQVGTLVVGGAAVVFSIDTFATVAGLLREVGESVASVAFTATYSILPDSATIDDNQTAPPPDALTTPFASFSRTGPFVHTTNGSTVVFTLAATIGTTTKNATITMTWGSRIYYGASVAGAHNEAFIEGLASNYLDTNRAGSFSASPGASQYIYFALPSSFGTPTFVVGGFEGGFNLVAAGVSVTNTYGVVQNYDIWRSDNTNLGATNVVVS